MRAEELLIVFILGVCTGVVLGTVLGKIQAEVEKAPPRETLDCAATEDGRAFTCWRENGGA